MLLARDSLFVAIACMAVVACSGKQQPTAAQPPAPDTVSHQLPAQRSPLAPLLVESIGDWQRHGETRTWSATSLDEYLGSDAERWRRYDLLDTVVGSYDRADGSIAIVELYRFRALSDAFGAYSTRRGFDARLVAVGDEGFKTTHSLLIWKGLIVVRIVGRSPDADALESLGRLTAASLPEGGSKPEALAFLAGMEVVPGTEILTREDALGYAMFRSSALARVRAGGAVIDLLRHEGRNGREALSLFEEFRGSVTLSAKTLDPVLGVGTEAFFAQDTHLANTLAFRAGNDVVVLRGHAQPETLIRVAERVAARLRAKRSSTPASRASVSAP